MPNGKAMNPDDFQGVCQVVCILHGIASGAAMPEISAENELILRSVRSLENEMLVAQPEMREIEA